ncbi:F-box domain-containing protein [Meloidogyne graminicola]|uniref:F-box domain-containing protein n=1 Tax=Meloidogyne graminicola TaxID=189291 RepID=A0A8S9ZBH2_9BILA|nr:F-box domain-containing protein [Meloidogyne graminicola]
MEYLPAEIQLKILQYLNYNELFSIKQTNHHFCEFINKYEGNLPRKEMRSFICTSDPYFINLEECSLKKGFLCLELPLFPKKIEELTIARYWLKKFFLCDFQFINFEEYIFNPEMIKLLFDNKEISKMKINCQRAFFYFENQNFNLWKFTFDRFVINNHLSITFENISTIEMDSNFLLELLLNKGKLFRNVHLSNPISNLTTLYNILINHIKTSTDLSKMVANIGFFSLENWHRSKLILSGVKRRESRIGQKYYKITNMHNSKIMFLISWMFYHPNSNFLWSIEINRFP